MTAFSGLELAMASVLLLFLAAAAAPLLATSQKSLINISFSMAALAFVLAGVAGFQAVRLGITQTMVLPIGLDELPFHMRLDPLSGFFITVISLLGFFVSIYSIGYLKGFIGQRSVAPLVFFSCLFMSGMLLVCLADNAYFFMIAWELMAASSYFLVCFEDERIKNRRAALLYIVIAHIGAIMILLAFGIMASSSSEFKNFDYTFSAMREAHAAPVWASAAFLLAFFGFAAKAGALPMHVWLPEAHPAAPSNISALMSGVMLKTAAYGILRVTFDLLHVTFWWWGGVVVAIGLVTALMGILYALMQNDLKRLLAYSSVENMGIILVCIGLAIIFNSFGMSLLASLALVAGLYHALNHAMFKGLLFMGAGAVLHSTRTRNMERLGGLIHKMKWTAPLFLIGCLAISGLPPFNGFVSEWLILQTFLLSPALPSRLLNLLMPLGAAVLALTWALAARCFLKVYGVSFMGLWRGPSDQQAHEVGWPMRVAMILAAGACLALGVLPVFVIKWIDAVPAALTGSGISASAGASGWLWLTPVFAERASYSAPALFLGMLAVVASVYAVSHAGKRRVRRAPTWDCGFEKLTNRMQYSSTSFSMPTRRIYGSLFDIRESARPIGPAAVNDYARKEIVYHLKVLDRLWSLLYMPLTNASFWTAKKIGRLQHGRIQIYLLYSFITLLALLVFA